MKKSLKIVLPILLALLIVLGAVLWKVAQQKPSVSPEVSTTQNNAWLDETFAEDSTGTDEEHTLPMVTVG